MSDAVLGMGGGDYVGGGKAIFGGIGNGDCRTCKLQHIHVIACVTASDHVLGIDTEHLTKVTQACALSCLI